MGTNFFLGYTTGNKNNPIYAVYGCGDGYPDSILRAALNIIETKGFEFLKSEIDRCGEEGDIADFTMSKLISYLDKSNTSKFIEPPDEDDGWQITQRDKLVSGTEGEGYAYLFHGETGDLLEVWKYGSEFDKNEALKEAQNSDVSINP